MPSCSTQKRRTKKRGVRKTSEKGLQTPGFAAKKRARRKHFRRDGVKTPNTALRTQIKKKVLLHGCGLCGCQLVDDNGRLLPKSRLDHCHRAEAPNGAGFLRGYLCTSCNALEGYYKWTKVGPDANRLLASAVRRKHDVICTKEDVCAFRQALEPVKKILF
jgi:hypothetical protein